MKKYESVYKLPDWIDIDYLNWDILSENPNIKNIIRDCKYTSIFFKQILLLCLMHNYT